MLTQNNNFIKYSIVPSQPIEECKETQEIKYSTNGNDYIVYVMLFLLIGALLLYFAPPFFIFTNPSWLTIPLIILLLFLCTGFFILQPNEAYVIMFFGNYIGTVKEPGIHWASPLSRFNY